MAIEKDQVYTRYDARDRAYVRIRITAYTPGAAKAHVVDADTGKRFRQILASSLHGSPTTKSGQQRRTGYVLEPPPDRFAWCFSHGRQHRFAADQEPWCTASWVWLDGASEAEALTTKAQVYGDARFLHELPDYQQLAIINGDVPGQRTEELPR